MRLNQFASLYLLITIFCVSSVVADDSEKSEYEVQVVAANPASGFNFPYILRTPNTTIAEGRRYLVVESNNTGVDDDFQGHIDRTKVSATKYGIGPGLANKLNVPLLMPVFPRSKSEWLVYTHALDRDTMVLADDPRQRLDLQLLNMVEDARLRLNKENIELNEKFVLVGFSASGTFSNRFAFLHPEKLLAVVSGAVNGIPMLPVASIQNRKLNYPLGLADFKEVSGKAFNLVKWKALPQMIFMGAVDDNDTVMFDDSFSSSERETVLEYVGEDILARWQKSQSIYFQAEPNVSFTTYGQIGHGTDGRINSDIASFVEITMRRANLKDKD